MEWTNILLNTIQKLKYKNEISQEEIDNHFYNTWEEIKYIYTPDLEKLSIYFENDIVWFKSKVAKYWLAYDLETVKETSNIELEYSEKYVKNHILYKEIILKDWHIYSKITDDILESIRIKIQDSKDRVDKDYIYQTQINDKQKELDWLQETFTKILTPINEYINKILLAYKEDNIYDIIEYLEDFQHMEKTFSSYYANYSILDSDWLKQSFLKFKNHKLKNIEEKSNELDKIRNYYLEVIGFQMMTLEKEIKSIKNWQKYYKEYKDKIYKWIFLKTNNKKWNTDNNYLSNKDIFNNLSKFVKKYLSDFYTVDENTIKLKNQDNKTLSDFKINDSLDDFSIKNTYFYDLKQTSFNKSNIDNKKNIIEFFTNFLFYKDYNGYSENKEVTRNITFLSIKENNIINNKKSLKNENIVFIEKKPLDKLLNSFHKELSINDFWDIFPIVDGTQIENNPTWKEYYSIQNEQWKNLSNYKDIKQLFQYIIFKWSVRRKIYPLFSEKININELSKKEQKEYISKLATKDTTEIDNFLNNIFDKLNNFILSNYIPISWFTITWRKNLNKWTGSVTPLLNLYKSNFQSYYTKFYQSTKDDIHNNISGETENYFDTNLKNMNLDFEKCISDSYEWLIEKINTRINDYCTIDKIKLD